MAANSLVYDVKRYYYGSLYASELKGKLKVSRDKLTEVIERVDELLQKESGEVTKQDKYKLQVFLAEVQKYQQMAITAAELARVALGVGIGKDADQPVQPESSHLVTEGATLHDYNTYLQMAKAHRPEYALIRDGVAAKKALVEAEKANYFPMLGLGGLFDFAATSDVRDDQGSPYAFDPYNRAVGGIGLVALWNLDLWNTKAKVDQLKAEHNMVLAKRELAARGIPAQIRKSFRELREAKERINIADTGRDFGKKWLIQAAFAFNFGLGETRDVIESVSGHAKAQQEYYQAIFDYNMALASLTKNVGNEVTDLSY